MRDRRPPTSEVTPAPGAFAALLDAVEHDAEAAEGLVQAYEALDDAARRALVDAVAEDRASQGRSARETLALLLAVERDAALARGIAEAMSALEDQRPEVARAWTWGSELDGGIVLSCQTLGAGHEPVTVRWAASGISVDRNVSSPAVRTAADPAESARAPRLAGVEPVRRAALPPEAVAVPWDAAVDRLATILWRTRVRVGKLPTELGVLATLFDRPALR